MNIKKQGLILIVAIVSLLAWKNSKDNQQNINLKETANEDFLYMYIH